MIGAGRRSPQLPLAEGLVGVGVHDLSGLLDLILLGLNICTSRAYFGSAGGDALRS
jgi:hypothetical protein